MTAGRRAAAAVLALSAALACGEARPPRWNVILVLVDTLRADRLSLYGYSRATSPNLDRFARRNAVVFRNAWSNAGCTFPSVNSLLTSRWPTVFSPRGRSVRPAGSVGSVGSVGMGIPADIPTLAQRLAATGYATGAVSASVIVRSTPSAINRKGGFGAGFGFFDEECERRSAACVNARALAGLGRLPEPFFLYLHYLDPHAPYRPPGWFQESFASGGEAVRPWARRGDPETILDALYPKGGEPRREVVERPEAGHLSDRYDDEVRFFDQQFESFLAELERRGVFDRTILVLVSDHGEELLDDGEWGHCRDLAFEPVLATPIVFALPARFPARPTGTRQALAANVDVVPTLLDLLQIPHDRGALAGRSLRPAFAVDREVQAYLYAVQGTRWAIRDARRSLSFDQRSSRWSSRPPSRLPSDAPPRELRAALLAWMKQRQQETPGHDTRDAVGQADELEAELRALGYL